jgi:uncharacterized protein DUF1996
LTAVGASLARIAAVVVSAAILGTSAAGQARTASPPLNGVNFISVCGFAHFAPDDPIVYPGRPGLSHLHAFVGNTSTSASSTLATLRVAGTTCKRAGDTAAYWMPALLVDGKPQTPLHADVYYRRTTNAKVTPFPPGLKMLAGNAYAVKPQSILVTYWDCGDLSDVPRGSSVPDCGTGSTLRLRVNFPDCWDGTRLDSPNHRLHMAYSVNGRCPRSRPVAVPGISVIYSYAMPSVANTAAEVNLASGGQLTGHADFINSWNQAALKKLVDSCLNRYRHCGTGS